MKPLLLTAFIAIISYSSFSQAFTFDPSTHKIDTVEAGNSAYMNIDIGFTDTNDILLKWYLIDNAMPAAWTYSLCDWPNCYPGIPDSGTMDTISASMISNGFEAFFNLSFSTHDTVDTGTAMLYFYDATAPNDGDTIQFTLITTPSSDTIDTIPTGVSNVGNKHLSIYPNPATDQLIVTGKEVQHVFIYNLQGAVIMDQPLLAKNSHTMDISALAAGSYFVSARTATGIHTEALVVLK